MITGVVYRWIIGLLILATLGGTAAGYLHGRKTQLSIDSGRYETLKAGYAQQLADAAAAAQAKQQAQAATISAIDAQHAQELQHAKQDADRTIADLRAGTLRLRREWSGCQATTSVPGTPASTGESDAAAGLRAASAARIIGSAAEADAQIRALQAVIRADRQQP